MTTGRIREIVFDDGVDASGTSIDIATKSYVDSLFDPITVNEKGIYLDNTSGLPTLSPWRSGVLAWDTEHDCLAVSTAYEDSWLQVGSEEQETVRNKTGSTLTNGQVVYIDGATGHIPEVKLATCTDETIAKRTIGVVTAESGIANNDTGPICLSGHVHGLNTNAFTVGDVLWLDTTSGSFTATRPSYQYEHIMIGIVLEKSPTDGVIYVEVRDLTDQIAKMGFQIIDPHGWTEYDNTYMTRSWNTGTRAFTLTQVGSSTPYYAKGKLKYLTGNKSITLANVPGPHYIGLNISTEVLEDLGSTFPVSQVISTHIMTEYAYVKGDGTVLHYGNERHTTKFKKWDWIYKHRHFSTQYTSGLTPSASSIDGNGSIIGHAQFAVTSGIIDDEDIVISIAVKNGTDNIKIFYFDGTYWTANAGNNGTGVVNTGTGRAAYNNVASGLVECTNNYHVLCHVFAANDGTAIVVMGQNQYQLLADARLAAKTEITTIVTTGLPMPEFRAIATFIYQTSNSYSNAVKSKIVSVDTGIPFYDWRTTALNPVAGSSVTNHNNLTGLQGGQAAEYYHLNASDYGNVSSKIYPGGAASDTGSKLILPTKADTSGLTPTAGNTIFDTTKKKVVIGDGSVFNEVGGGLAVTPVTHTINGSTLESGKHYLIDMNGASADVTVTAPAIGVDTVFKVTVVRNYANPWRVIINASGSDKFYYANDSTFTSVRLYNPDSWAEFSKLGTNLYALNTDENAGGSGSGGSGEKNYITNPSGFADTSGWGVVGDFNAVTRTTTAAELPREYTTKTGLKLTATSGTQSALDYYYYDFNLDDVDLNKTLKIEWSQKIVGTYSAGQMQVWIAAQSARGTALHTPKYSSIPAADGIFRTSFDSASTAALSLVIAGNTDMTTGDGLVISDVIVGPGSIQAIPAIDSPISVTMTTQNTAAGYTVDAKMTRTGEWAKFQGEITLNGANSSTIYLNMPSGMTINQSGLGKGNQGTQDYQVVGSAVFWDQSTGILYSYAVWVNQVINSVYFLRANGTTEAIGASTPVTAASPDVISFLFEVPIAQWANSSISVGQNREEFASNSSVDNADNTSSFAYGPTGSRFPAVATANKSKRVRFQYPIQQGDKIVIEIMNTNLSSNTWISIETATTLTCPYKNEYQTSYGIGWTPYSATEIDVVFGIYRLNSGNSYGAAGLGWSDIDDDARYLWRVRKVSGGTAVGFGIVQPGYSSGLVSHLGLPGNTTGNAITAGCVGEVKYSVQAGTFNPTSGQWSDMSVFGLSLTAGTWSIDAWSYTERGSATINDQLAAIGITTSSGNSGTGISYGKNAMPIYWPTTTSPSINGSLSLKVRCDGSNIYLEDGTSMTGTTIYFKHYQASFTGTLAAKGKMTAVRIA